MQRDIQQLKTQHFDAVIVGAGIHGACIARDASLRGLRVALIDKGDLCGATSHNSLKTIHGGIRYLQHLNFKRTLQCINEQNYWLRTAPHLVKPLPFLMPTYGHGTRGLEAMWCGLRLYAAMSFGRIRKLPKGRIISVKECLKLAPSTKREGLTGGAIWYDAQAENTDRAVIEIVQSAAKNNACIANYVVVEKFVIENNTVIGVRAQDTLTEEQFTIQSNLVINAAGPWAASLLSSSQNTSLTHHHLPLTKSMNVVTRKILPEYAIGVQSKQQSDSVIGSSQRLYFIVPWRKRSIIGTTHFRLKDGAVKHAVNKAETRMEIEQFIHEINAAYPQANLSIEDIIYCYQGLTPANEPNQHAHATRLHHSKIIDHANSDSINGLISVISIKWTTARLIAEQVIDLAIKKTNKQIVNLKPCQTRSELLPNANSPISYLHIDSSDKELTQFVNRAVTEEMTLSLDDLLLRRTDALMQNALSPTQIKIIAKSFANHLNWHEEEKNKQLEKLKRSWLAPEIQKKLTADFIWS